MIQSRAIAIQGDFIRSKSIGWQGVQIARTVGDSAIEGLGLLNLSQIIGFTGNLEECIPMLENSLVLLQESGDIWGQATAMSVFSLNNLDMEQSKSYLVKALHLYRDLGDLSGIADCLSLLAQKNLWTGNFSAAAQKLEESLEITRQIGSQSDEAQILGYFGNLAYWQGNYRQARDYFEESIALGEKINFQMSVLWARVNRAYAVLKQGDTQQALVEFGNSIRHMQQAGVLIGVVFAIEGLASLYLTVGQPARAARLIAWGDAIRKKTGDHRPLAEQKSVDRDLAAIQAQLDEAEFTRISTEGLAMTIEQVIDDALSENR